MNKDITRTNHLRDEPHLHGDVKRVVEFYCLKLNVAYCQGMLEVLLPFLYMKSKQFDLAHVYAYFKRFVLTYLPNNLHAKFNGRANVLPYLKCCLSLTSLVLQYADRELHYHLKQKGVCIEMYAASWVMTLFTRVVGFDLIYELWEIFLFERDKYFIFYFAVAMVRLHRQRILSLKTFEALLKYLPTIAIPDFAKLAETY